MQIPVFSTRFVPAWGKRGDTNVTENMEISGLTDVREALEKQYDTDAHGAAYMIEGEEVCARLAKDVLRIEDVKNRLKMVAAFVDLDRYEHSEWPDRDSAVRNVALLARLFPNAAVFTTRRGIRLVFLLARPTPALAYAQVAGPIVEDVKDKIAKAAVDVAVDDTTVEWTRLFRMPKVMRDGTPTWEDSTFVLHIPENWSPLHGSHTNVTDATIVPAEALVPAALGDMPNPIPIDAEEWKKLISEFADPLARAGWNGLMGKLRDGEPFFEQGNRNSTTFRALNAFVDIFQAGRGDSPSPVAVFSMFYGATAATKGNTPASTAVAELWDMVCRIVEAQEYTENDVHEVLPQKMVLSEWGQIPLSVYTGGRSRYIWDSARKSYTEPIGNDDSYKAAFIDLWGAIYGLKSATTLALLNNHGTFVDDVILDLTAQAPRVEATHRARSLVLPVGKRVVVPSVFHADVDEWLTALAGADREGLLSWLHYALKFDHPLCALYLSGSPSAGKSMIAQAVAQFLSGTYVEFDEAVSRFNGRLRNSPLIWLDEVSAEPATGKFRSLVGNSTHKIERKGVDAETLRGNLRMIITANNEDALRLDDIRTIHDVEAITQRVRYIRVGNDSADLLRKRGGRDYTSDWVLKTSGAPGKLCEHIAWLAEHYVPATRGSRFRVEGIPTAWHYRALYSGGVGAVLALLADKIAMNRKDGVAYFDPNTRQILVRVVNFLSDPGVRANLKSEGVDPQDARATLRSVCVEGSEVVSESSTWSVIPLSIIADMPRVAYRSEKTYDLLRDILNGA